MNHSRTNDDAQSGKQKNLNKQQKKRVDVATLEKSTATSNPKNPGPIAVGEASG